MIRAAAIAALLAAGCTSFDYTRCGEHVCAPGLACCGDACVPETCGDEVLQPAEQCDTWGRRACVASGFDFGQVACTATCALDESPCTSFRFRAGGLPCDLSKPAQLATAGDTLWAGTRLRQAVRADARGCATATLTTVPTRVLAMSADEAIAILNPPALQVVTPTGVVDVPFTLPAVQSAVVIDPHTAILGHSAGLLTIVERGDAGWTARAVTLTCPPAGLRRIDALARWGDDLVVVFAATIPDLGTVPLAELGGTTAAARCADLLGLPPVPDFSASPADASGIYLVGNATDPAGIATGIVVRVAPGPDGVLAATVLRGAAPFDPANGHVAPIAPLQRAWLDPAGALHVASRADAQVLRDGRWRHLDAPIGRDFGPTVAYRGLSVTATVAGALVSEGHGYEIADDLALATHPARCAAGATSCTVAASGRGHGAAWMLVTQVLDGTTTRTLARDGVPLVRDVAGVPALPLLLGFGPDGEHLVARPTGRSELYHWQGVDDPAPARLAASCSIAALDLDAGATGAAVAVRLGRVDDTACPREHAVVRRRAADGVVETLWTTPDEIRQVAVPADGSDAVIVLVTARDPAGAITGNRIVEVRADGTAHERASLEGGHDVRALWADDRDHAWLAGDRGLLLRWSGDRFLDRAADLGLIAGATLRALAGTGPADVFLSGDDNLLFHFDGVAWTAVSPSSQLASFAALAVGADDVWISAGDRALALRVPRAPPVAPSCPAE